MRHTYTHMYMQANIQVHVHAHVHVFMHARMVYVTYASHKSPETFNLVRSGACFQLVVKV